MKREVYVKATYPAYNEVGVGSVPARLLWESDPGEYGEFVHLARTKDGRLWLSFTDMEEHGGSYTSVEVTDEDLTRLSMTLTAMEES
jgi:hypothetical protein